MIAHPIKIRLMQTLLRFEDIALSLDEIDTLTRCEKLEDQISDPLDLQIVQNVLAAFAKLETQDLHAFAINEESYADLNATLACNQALFAGRYRKEPHETVYISGLDEPVEPPDPELLHALLLELEHLDDGNFRQTVSRTFCTLARMQPFFDGNKRSSLLICNLALLKRNLGAFVIGDGQYDPYQERLAKFYQDRDPSVLDYLSENCVYSASKIQELIPG